MAKRALHLSGGALAGALACAVVAAGGVRTGALGAPDVGSILLLASAAVLVVCAVARRVRFEPPSARAQRSSFWLAAAPALVDVELSLALIASTYAVIAATGGVGSPIYPLLYGVIAFSVTLQSRPGMLATLGSFALLELAAFLRAPFGLDATTAFLLHMAFAAGAAAAHALFLRGLVARHRRMSRVRLAREVARQREAVRDYRLISAALGADSRAPRRRADEEHILAVGGVEAIGAAVFYTLDLIKRCLGARTVILLWTGGRGEGLKIRELVTDTDAVTEAGRVADSGVVGAVCRDRRPLLVPRVRPGQIAYYDRALAEDEVAFVGVPVLEGGHLRGVIAADRAQPFEPGDAELLLGATEQILRCVRSEQVFLAVERSKYEHERFYQASALLGSALTLSEVLETAFDAAAQIVPYDVAAISIYDAQRKLHRVASARVVPGAEPLCAGAELAGLEFRDNAGLVSMVVKNRHYLPAGGELRDVTSPIFTRRVRLKGAESLLVLPLLSGDEAVGAFMLASRAPRRFDNSVRDMLGVIANQVAVALKNGMMYEKMELMATTDGLTGLTNHRTFQERFAQLLERAERHRHAASILLCDVDHFKSVNDTYGHPVGDEVLRQVARVLREAVRKIDIPARYGGEEFAVVLESTDRAGAMQLAERIRNEVGALRLDSDKGPFQVTMSIGIATFPDDARERADLIERADAALYHAKQTGRNRCVTYFEYIAAQRRAAS